MIYESIIFKAKNTRRDRTSPVEPDPRYPQEKESVTDKTERKVRSKPGVCEAV